ncbi:MAG: hypothetical protein IPJ11_15500 [Gemmatimonadetes bacterium]|nr:hypothetical protein [Gemmatimonadota bacterium]
MNRFSRLMAMGLVLFLALGSMLYMAYLIDEAARKGFEFLIVGLFGLVGMGFLLFTGPVGKAIAAMLEGKRRRWSDRKPPGGAGIPVG